MIKYALLGVALCGVLVVGSGAVREFGVAHPASVTAAESTSEAAIEAALGRRMPSVGFEACPLEDFLAWWRAQAGINVYVACGDEDDKTWARVYRHTITMYLSDVTLETVLRLVLDTVEEDTPMGFESRNGVLVIAPEEVLGQRLETRVYPVGDLVGKSADGREREANGDEPSLAKLADPDFRELLAGAPPGGVVVEGNPDELAAPSLRKLTEIIECTVDPDSWACNGGCRPY